MICMYCLPLAGDGERRGRPLSPERPPPPRFRPGSRSWGRSGARAAQQRECGGAQKAGRRWDAPVPWRGKSFEGCRAVARRWEAKPPAMRAPAGSSSTPRSGRRCAERARPTARSSSPPRSPRRRRSATNPGGSARCHPPQAAASARSSHGCILVAALPPRNGQVRVVGRGARRAASRDALPASAPQQDAAARRSKGDASLSASGPDSPVPRAGGVRDSALGAAHACDGPGGCSGSAARQGAASASAPSRHSSWSSRCCRGRSAGRERLDDDRRRS